MGGPILQDPPCSKILGSHLGSISQARWAADENHGLGARKKKWEIVAGNKPKIMRYHGIISNVMKYVLDCFSMF